MSELDDLRFQKQVAGRAIRDAKVCVIAEAQTAALEHITEAIYALASVGNAKVVHQRQIEDTKAVQAVLDADD